MKRRFLDGEPIQDSTAPIFLDGKGLLTPRSPRIVSSVVYAPANVCMRLSRPPSSKGSSTLIQTGMSPLSWPGHRWIFDKRKEKRDFILGGFSSLSQPLDFDL